MSTRIGPCEHGFLVFNTNKPDLRAEGLTEQEARKNYGVVLAEWNKSIKEKAVKKSQEESRIQEEEKKKLAEKKAAEPKSSPIYLYFTADKETKGTIRYAEELPVGRERAVVGTLYILKSEIQKATKKPIEKFIPKNITVTITFSEEDL